MRTSDGYELGVPDGNGGRSLIEVTAFQDPKPVYVDKYDALFGAGVLSPGTGGYVPPCKVPPRGWRCARRAGHDGPCAAEPTTFWTRLWAHILEAW